ncbi:hypothetical protein F5148DRAFT_1152710 [Russula earlei]|uniref:Uncharacterized protein n=1 Tax=Russula earlei TaxID=71964 RepID=A0ACC0TVG8_9AGAM|nr:hypothetical protein F5148DRAFT_1152710 [Russula earlei]
MKQTKILVVQGMDVDEGAQGMGEVGGDRAEVLSLFLGVEWAMQGNDVERGAWRDDMRGKETRDKGKGRCVGEGREGGGGKCKSLLVNVLPWKQTGLKGNLSWVDIRENVTSPPAIARGMKESSGVSAVRGCQGGMRLRQGDMLIWVPTGNIGRLHDLVRVRAEDV